jgi:hypothetical protein
MFCRLYQAPVNSIDLREIVEVIVRLCLAVYFLGDNSLADDFTSLIVSLGWVVDEFQGRKVNF